jgi:tetratricopeptide (TPR) repeat protein
MVVGNTSTWEEDSVDDEEARRERFFELTDRGWQHSEQADDIIRRNLDYLEDTGQLPMGVSSHPMPPAAINELRLAASAYHEALRLVTEENGKNYPIVHLQLGTIYLQLEVLDRAADHLVEAIRVFEAMGYRMEAGHSRANLARLHFYKGGRYHDAFVQARAALLHYQSCGPDAAGNVERMRRLMADISAHLPR